MNTDISIQAQLRHLKDPRKPQNLKHPLSNIIIIAVCAMLSGADDYDGFELFGNTKKEFLGKFLNLEQGIPDSYTFRRLFMRLEPKAFGEWFRAWVMSCHESLAGKHISLDGKWLNGSNREGNAQSAIKMVNAWVSELGISFGQMKVEEGSNEIATLPKLLKLLCLKGCIVTMDAAHCQANNSKIVIEQGGDYVVPVKKNQKSLYEKVGLAFDMQAHKAIFTNHIHSVGVVEEKGHGRYERRECEVIMDEKILEWIDAKGRWHGLKSIARISRERWEKKNPQKRSKKVVYAISSLKVDGQTFNDCVRQHWDIESKLHWVLDVAFNEDGCRISDGNAAANLATLRQVSLNLIKQDANRKHSMKVSRLRAGWSDKYLFGLIQPLLENS